MGSKYISTPGAPTAAILTTFDASSTANGISSEKRQPHNNEQDRLMLLSEWNKIFQFLNWNPPTTLTFDDVMNASDLASTTASRHHSDIIEN